jgi:cytosine/adenosine deaminase-related metal-dependent hydrolase
VAVGDVSNTLASVPKLRASGLGGCVFHELIGFDVPNPAAAVQEAWVRIAGAMNGPSGGADAGVGGGLSAGAEANPARAALPLSASVSAHAPYSVAPDLFAEIVRQHGIIRPHRAGPLTVHVGESVEEIEFLRHGRGPFRELLQELGVWRDNWYPPGCGPVEYLDRLGYLIPGVLAVHGVHLNDTAFNQLREAEAVLVVCPRSNVWVGAGMPNVSRAYALGLQVALGTDSLASVPTLNLFDELAELRRIAPEVSAASLLESATRIGAQALGLGRLLGTLGAGKRAALTTVTVATDERDVEEYLVSGVPESAVRPLWL